MTDLRLRIVGSVIAVAVACLMTANAFAVTGTAILAPGIPVVGLLALWLTPLLDRDRGVAIGLMAFLAVPPSAFIFVLGALLVDETLPLTDVVGGALVGGAIGTVIIGIPSLIVTLPAAVLWAFLVETTTHWLDGRRQGDAITASTATHSRSVGSSADSQLEMRVGGSVVKKV